MTTLTLDDIVLRGVTEISSSGGWDAPEKRAERGLDYDSYIDREKIEGSYQAWVDQQQLRELQQLRDRTEPFPASIDQLVLPKAKLEDLEETAPGDRPGQYQVTVRIKEVREARLDRTAVTISTPEGDLGTSSEDATETFVQSEEDDSGATDEASDEGGIVGTLASVREGLSGILS